MNTYFFFTSFGRVHAGKIFFITTLWLATCQSLSAQTDTLLARQCLTRAAAFFEEANYPASLTELGKAAAIYRQTANWQPYLTCQEKTAATFIQQGRFDAAEQTLSDALVLAAAKLKKTPPQQADLLNLLGFVQLNKGRNDLALENFNTALRLYQQLYPEKHPKTADCYTNFGLLYNSTGNTALASEFLGKALLIRQQLYGETHESIADASNNLGLTYVQEDKEQALAYFVKALSIYRKIHGENHPKTARVYNNLALVYFQQKDYGNALSNYRKALSVFEQLYNDKHPNVAFVESSMGQVFEAQADYTKALSYQQQALDIYRAAYGKKHYEIANTLNLIGNIYRKQQKYRQALENYQQALCENSTAFNSTRLTENPAVNEYYNPVVMLVSLLAKARTLEELFTQQTLKRSDLDLGLETLEQADKLIDNIRQIRTGKSDKLALGAVASEVYETAIRLSLSLSEVVLDKKYYREKAFYFSEKSKTAVLLESIADARAKQFANIPDSLVQQEKQLKADITFYEQKLAEKPDAPQETLYRNKLFSLNRAYEAFTKQLEQRFPQYYNLKFNVASVSATQLRDLLDDKTALISYFIGEENSRLYVFYLTHKGLQVFDTPKNEYFDSYLVGFRNAIRSNVPKVYARTAFALYHSLFPEKLPASVNKLIIIPDGRLGTLPFEALLSKKTKADALNYQLLSYLLNTFAVSYDYSATLYFQTAQAKAMSLAKPAVLLVAPVVFGEAAGPLPGSETEVNEIAALFAQKGFRAVTCLREKATEGFIKSSEMKKYNFLHFATHGLADGENPELSEVFFVKEGGQDGNLFAGEIYNCEFRADLVALSACQTGLGKVAKGEGMIGLCRALVYAGARNLLVSLWSVSDKSTAVLTRDFYKNLLGNTNSMDYSVAIRQAKLSMLQNPDFSRPYYWAAFVLIGK